MSERNPFEQQPTGPESLRGARRELRCEDWEALLVDALDGALPAADGAAFETHGSTCAACSALLAQARQGQEWMQFLQDEPEMPGDLMERILGRTSGAVVDRPLAVYGAPIPAGPNVTALPRRRFVWDTRLMMTAAMAFFSIALTLNLAGVRLTDLRLSDLTPASLESNLTRQFYGAKSQFVRYYDNLRFVYEVESKMRELRRDEDTPRPAQQSAPTTPVPQNNVPQNNAPASATPGGHKTGGKLEPVPAMPRPDVSLGREILADEHWQEKSPALCPNTGEVVKEEKGVENLVAFLRDQAERSLA
jgi:hypothetical protein